MQFLRIYFSSTSTIIVSAQQVQSIFDPLDIEPYATKSRKSLDFSTPSCRRKGRNLDESIYTPLESPASDNNKQSKKFSGLRNEPRKASKNNNNLNKRKGKSINRLRCPV